MRLISATTQEVLLMKNMVIVSIKTDGIELS